MEPRAYSPTPVGTNFIASVLGVSDGEVLVDPTLPLSDVQATFALASVGYGRTFGLFRRPALVAIAVPFVHGHVEGQVQEQARRVERTGFGDLRVRLSTQLFGPRAMTPAEFATAPRKTIVGASLVVQAPTGEYDETKLVNLGTNRWAFKPELGVSVPVGRWFLDAYAGAWLFTANDTFYPGDSVRRQDPLRTIQGHGSYTLPSHAWVAFDATWYGGGEAALNGGPPTTRQSNTRIGATVSLPLPKQQSIKIAASTGAAVRSGSDFDTLLVAWQIVWFDRPRPVAPGAP